MTAHRPDYFRKPKTSGDEAQCCQWCAVLRQAPWLARLRTQALRAGGLGNVSRAALRSGPRLHRPGEVGDLHTWPGPTNPRQDHGHSPQRRQIHRPFESRLPPSGTFSSRRLRRAFVSLMLVAPVLSSASADGSGSEAVPRASTCGGHAPLKARAATALAG